MSLSSCIEESCTIEHEEAYTFLGDRVYCHADTLGIYGEVKNTRTLGLKFAVTAQGADGVHRLYCGKEMTNLCHVMPLMVTEMKKIGISVEDIQKFKAAWFNNVTDSAQRIQIKDDLIRAASTNDAEGFIESIRTLLGLI